MSDLSTDAMSDPEFHNAENPEAVETTGQPYDDTPADPPAPQEAAPATIDNPNQFDPVIHAVNEDGTPRLRVDGSYALKRGRKKAVETPADADRGAPPKPPRPSTAAPRNGPVFQGAAQVQISNQEAARQTCNLVVGGLVQVFGSEWAPRDKSEAESLTLAVKNYFDAKGQIKLSPEWGLVFAIGAYSLPRLNHENTKSKLRVFGDKLKVGYYALHAKFGRKRES